MAKWKIVHVDGHLSVSGKNGKGKDDPVPSFLTQHHAMKKYWESGGITPLIL
jgi:hypothetical protein